VYLSKQKKGVNILPFIFQWQKILTFKALLLLFSFYVRGDEDVMQDH
jgi:hypothetical protein